MNFKTLNSNTTMRNIEEDILKYWEEEQIFKKISERHGNSGNFIFLEGPPTANGKPHVGHALTRTIKDTPLRYKTMRGYNIGRRSGGWDCHGLPVELEAEKHFGFKTKDEIVKFGIEKFNRYCKESVFRYIDEWNEMDRRIGFWVDGDSSYITLRDDYIESEWWALKTLFQRGDLYKDFRISPYCPRCETTLSSHELAQGYKTVKDTSIYAMFRIEGEDRYLLAWTTTPWTLPSNMLLAVNSEVEYSDVESEGKIYVVASALAPRIFNKGYKILKTYKGSELLGKKYRRPIDLLKVSENSCLVVHGDHVNLEDGTGIVHTAPAFGADDFDLGKKYNTGLLNPVDAQGRFNSSDLPWNGMFVKDADLEIVKYLKEKGMALKSEKHEHTYPFCYRCSTPLLYYPIDAWFIRVSAYSGEMVKNNSNVNWVPDYLKNGRFGNFIEDAKDWNLSRNRYWGTPLPVWKCSKGHMIAVGSKSELMELGAKSMPEELHRPYVDNIFLKCQECGEEMQREPFVIDTWFDSGSATYAALHYPHNGKSKPELPVSFIGEAIDQTRGWFYTLHAISTLLFGTNAYANVLCAEFILDEDGKKMSKSKGNGILAMELLDKFGADATRLFFYSTAAWKPKPLVEKVVKELETKILGTLLNMYSFFSSNANLDGYQHHGLLKSNNLLDKWLLSRINTTVANVTKAMDSYEFHDAQRLISDLIDQTSNVYLRLSRRRFWDPSDSIEGKNAAYSVLFHALEVICRLLAPIAPFTTEFVYRNLMGGNESVHASSYPECDDKLVDQQLEASISKVSTVLELTRRARQGAGIKGRQPVKSILVLVPGLDGRYLETIREEMNAKEIKIIGEEEKPTTILIKPNLQVVAPLLKSNLGEFHALIEKYNSEGRGKYFLSENATFKGIPLDDKSILTEEIPAKSFTLEKDGEILVFLNSEIDEDLEKEGFARELIRRIQIMRKELNIEYDRKIRANIEGEDLVGKVLKIHGKRIGEETLISEFLSTHEPNAASSKEWDIDGKTVTISLYL